MSRKTRKALTSVVAVILLVTMVIGCSNGNGNNVTNTGNSTSKPTESQSPTEPQEIVVIKSIFPGEKPAGLDTVLEEINKKMGEEIGVNLELTWAPWDQYANKITLSAATGDPVDFFWNGSSNLSEYYSQKLLAPIDEVMEEHGQIIYDNIDKRLFDSMKIDGQLYGIPSTGNSPLSNVYQSILYREDLREKYELPKPDSVENFELFLKGIKENDPTMVPLTSASVAYIIMNQYGPESYLGGTGSSVGFKINDDQSVTVMPTQEIISLRQASVKVHEWFEAGYIPSDILNIGDVTARIRAGATAVVNGAALTASENQNLIAANVPGAILDNQGFSGEKKYISGNGGNGLYVTSTTKKADSVIKYFSWVFANQENFDLYNYGIEGVNYEIVNDRVKLLNNDYADFPGWMFKNMNYLRFPEGITDEYIERMKNWDEGGEISPLMGFTFNPENVKTELAQVKQVFNAYSKTFNSGIVDPETIWPEFEKKMKAAGQDKVVEEAQMQVDEFLASK